MSGLGSRIDEEDRKPYDLREHPPLPAAALHAVGRLRGLTALTLVSWQLPHCTAAVLACLAQLQRLHLCARQLPPGCLEAVQRLTSMRSLELDTTVNLGPVAQLSSLARLTSLRLQQCNWPGEELLPPPVACLPHLQSYTFKNRRGPLMVRKRSVS